MRGVLIAATGGFETDRALRLSPHVGLRPEPFGALAYHFDTRRLVFLKSAELVELVHALSRHRTAADAVSAASSSHSTASYIAALASLEEAGVICEQ